MRQTQEELQTEFLGWLDDCRKRVDACEAHGKEAAEKMDDDAYRRCMQEKAEFLQSLFPQAEKLLGELPGSIKEYPLTVLQRFSNNAASALRIGSVFFMSALLFPDDHKPGEPNDLDRFFVVLNEQWKQDSRP